MDIQVGKELYYIDSFGFKGKVIVFHMKDNGNFLISHGICRSLQYDDSMRELNIKDEGKLFWEIEESA